MDVFVQLLTLVRVLFPKWNFFDQLGDRFFLKYRTLKNADWTLVEFKSNRTLLSLVFNPHHNLTLAQVSAVELFVQDVQNHEETKISHLDSFKIIKSLVETYTTSDSFQFQIEAQKDNLKFEIYISSWLKRFDL